MPTTPTAPETTQTAPATTKTSAHGIDFSLPALSLTDSVMGTKPIDSFADLTLNLAGEAAVAVGVEEAQDLGMVVTALPMEMTLQELVKRDLELETVVVHEEVAVVEEAVVPEEVRAAEDLVHRKKSPEVCSSFPDFVGLPYLAQEVRS